jgi:hypothetical protein
MYPPEVVESSFQFHCRTFAHPKYITILAVAFYPSRRSEVQDMSMGTWDLFARNSLRMLVNWPPNLATKPPLWSVKDRLGARALSWDHG